MSYDKSDPEIKYRDTHTKRQWLWFAFFCLAIIVAGALGGYILWARSVTASWNSIKLVSPVVSSTSVHISVPPIASITSTSTAVAVSPTVSSTTSTPIVTPQSPMSGEFGMSMGETLLGLSPQNLNTELNNIAALGVGWIRFDINWDHVQPTSSSTFNWYGIDQLVAAANAHHIKLLPIIDYTPPWSRSTACSWAEHCLPADNAVFGAFVQAAVERYAPQGVSDWEIWNEENIAESWEPAASASQYVPLLKVAYTTIKQVEPSSTVIIGGLAPSANDWRDTAPVTFLADIYQDGGKGYFDAVGDHPYTFPALPSSLGGNAWAQMSETSTSLRSIMIANGDGGKKIWLTEFGAPTNGPDAKIYESEFQQAETAADAFHLYSEYDWAGPLFWYSFQDLGTATNTDENFFGITRHDGSTKPAYWVIKNILSGNF